MGEIVNFDQRPMISGIVRTACRSFNRENLPSATFGSIDCVYPKCALACKFGGIAIHIMKAIFPERLSTPEAQRLKSILQERFPDYHLLIVPSDTRKIYQNHPIWQELWREDKNG